eukprot:scaffold4510_cov183-Amphora_coffeaeformis.AAC.82
MRWERCCTMNFKIFPINHDSGKTRTKRPSPEHDASQKNSVSGVEAGTLFYHSRADSMRRKGATVYLLRIFFGNCEHDVGRSFVNGAIQIKKQNLSFSNDRSQQVKNRIRNLEIESTLCGCNSCTVEIWNKLTGGFKSEKEPNTECVLPFVRLYCRIGDSLYCNRAAEGYRGVNGTLVAIVFEVAGGISAMKYLYWDSNVKSGIERRPEHGPCTRRGSGRGGNPLQIANILIDGNDLTQGKCHKNNMARITLYVSN